jgi:predicted AAA+ superfamily ATPase
MLNLIAFNRWWDTGRVEDVYLKPFKRPLFYELMKSMDMRQIIIIYGIRRVGKTTLMYQLIDHLLRNGVNRKNILLLFL